MHLQSCCFAKIRTCPHYCVFKNVLFRCHRNASINLHPQFGFEAFSIDYFKTFENGIVACWEVSWTMCACYNHAPATFPLCLKAYSNFSSSIIKRTFFSWNRLQEKRVADTRWLRPEGSSQIQKYKLVPLLMTRKYLTFVLTSIYTRFALY